MLTEEKKVLPLRVGMSAQRLPDPCIMVIFGATGDLTHRKLMPALFDLYSDGKLPRGFSVDDDPMGCFARLGGDQGRTRLLTRGDTRFGG